MTFFNLHPPYLFSGFCIIWTLLFLLPLHCIRIKSCDFLPSVLMFLFIICCKGCWRAEGQQRAAERLAVTFVQLCRASSAAWTGCYQCSCIEGIGEDKTFFPLGFYTWCDSDSQSVFRQLNVRHAIVGNGAYPLHFMGTALFFSELA